VPIIPSNYDIPPLLHHCSTPGSTPGSTPVPPVFTEPCVQVLHAGNEYKFIAPKETHRHSPGSPHPNTVSYRENLFNTSETRTLPTEYHPSFFIPAKTQRFTHSLKIKQKIVCLGKCLGRHPCKLCYHLAWHYKKSVFRINFISLPAGFWQKKYQKIHLGLAYF